MVRLGEKRTVDDLIERDLLLSLIVICFRPRGWGEQDFVQAIGFRLAAKLAALGRRHIWNQGIAGHGVQAAPPASSAWTI